MTKYGYARISKEDAAKHSIEAQTNNLINAGVIINNIFIDDGRRASIQEDDFEIINNEDYYGITLKKSTRPAFGKLLDTIKKGDDLYITFYDRISRDMLVQELFLKDMQKRKVTLHPLMDIEHPLTRRVLGAVATQEIDKLKDRIHQVKKDQYERGIHPSKSPYGYLKNTINEEGKLKYPGKPEGLIINHKESETVKQIFQDVIKGKNYKETCQKLKIGISTYYNIIKNPVYKGLITYKGEHKQGVHEPIINSDDWEWAQKVLSSHNA